MASFSLSKRFDPSALFFFFKYNISSFLEEFHIPTEEHRNGEHQSPEDIIQKHADPYSIEGNGEVFEADQSKEYPYSPGSYGFNPEGETGISQAVAYPFVDYHQTEYGL